MIDKHAELGNVLLQANTKYVYFSLLPLAHIFDQILETYFITKGTSIGFWQGDVRYQECSVGFRGFMTVYILIKQSYGGRVRIMFSRGAPLARHVEEFLRVTYNSVVVQGYGES